MHHQRKAAQPFGAFCAFAIGNACDLTAHRSLIGPMLTWVVRQYRLRLFEDCMYGCPGLCDSRKFFASAWLARLHVLPSPAPFVSTKTRTSGLCSCAVSTRDHCHAALGCKTASKARSGMQVRKQHGSTIPLTPSIHVNQDMCFEAHHSNGQCCKHFSCAVAPILLVATGTNPCTIGLLR